MQPKNVTSTGKKTANVSPAYTRVIEEFRNSKKTRTLGQYYDDWNKYAKTLETEDPEAGIRELMKNVSPKDLGFTCGPAMTEEQFKAYRESKGPRFSDLYNDYHSLQKKDSK